MKNRYTDQAILVYNPTQSMKYLIALDRKFFLKNNRHSLLFKGSRTKDSKESQSKDESPNSPDSASKTPITPRIYRLYIVGHSLPGSQYLYGDDNSKTDYKEVANHVVSILKQINNNSLSFHPDSYIKISIIACSAGSGDEKGNRSGSFAENLYTELRLKGITADVVARVKDLVMRCNLAQFWKETVSFNNERRTVHHQPGSKMLFTLDEKGKPIFKDAYSASWKSRVLTTIQNCATKTKKENKRRCLHELHKQLKNQSEDVIFETLKLFIEQKKSFADEGDFFGKTNTRKAFESLVAEGIRTIKSPHTIATTTLK